MRFLGFDWPGFAGYMKQGSLNCGTVRATARIETGHHPKSCPKCHPKGHLPRVVQSVNPRAVPDIMQYVITIMPVIVTETLRGDNCHLAGILRWSVQLLSVGQMR